MMTTTNWALDIKQYFNLQEYVRALIAMAHTSDGEGFSEYEFRSGAALRATHRWGVWLYSPRGRCQVWQGIAITVTLWRENKEIGTARFVADDHPIRSMHSAESYYKKETGPAEWWNETLSQVRKIESIVESVGLGGFENAITHCQSSYRRENCGLATEVVGKVPTCSGCLYDERRAQEEIARAERAAVRKENELRRSERSKLTNKLRWRVINRDGRRCKHCGKGPDDGVKLHVDHIVPIVRGGLTEESNLQALCVDCNLGKSTSMQSSLSANEASLS